MFVQSQEPESEDDIGWGSGNHEASKILVRVEESEINQKRLNNKNIIYWAIRVQSESKKDRKQNIK